jgi:hypothetical protein
MTARNERSEMKAIVIVAAVLPESGVESLVRTARRVDGRRGARDAAGLQPPLPGLTPRRETSLPGPSPAGEWTISRFRRIARTSGTPLRAATMPASQIVAVNERTHVSADAAVSNELP